MTLYRHFSSKDHLIEDVLKKREEQYLSYLDSYTNEGLINPFLQVVKAHGQGLKDKGKKGAFGRKLIIYRGRKI